MNIYMLLIYMVLALSAISLPAHAMQTADSDDLCSPFENTVIEKPLIASMLKAADDGYLYRINPESSKMGFCVDSTVGRVNGQFEKFNGGIALEGRTNQTMVKVDLDSLETDGVFFESIIKGESFFDVDHHPELLFVSTGFEWISPKKGVLKGRLTLRGTTQEVAFYVDITELEDREDDTILVKATTTVNRSEFGMKSMPSMVNDKVNLCMSVEAKRYVAEEPKVLVRNEPAR
jgi:polyisoprenoid-binding protein YceI